MSHARPTSDSVVLADAALRYAGDVGLGPTTLRVVDGERVGLLGSSGSGKSTLLKLLAGIAEPTSGSVELWGINRQAATRDQRRTLASKVGMLHQDLHLTGQLRVIHNVNAGRLGQWSASRSLWSLVRPVERDETSACLDAFGIAHLIDARTSTLSGGEQQRVALARLARHQPSLILADEPTTGLDPVRADEAMRLLTTQAESTNATLIVSLHDPELARRFCTRIVALQDGMVMFDGPVSTLASHDLAALYAPATP